MKWISLVAVLFVLPITSHAASSQVSSQDRSWLIAAHQSNLSEIQSGKLAERSGHTDAVRDAGRMLASDHAELDAKLKPVAKQFGITLPERPNAEQREEMKRFQGLSGTKFDTTWAHGEADGHVKAIDMTEREVSDGSSPEVKQLAQSALPVLKKHLSTLRQASTEVTGS